MSHLPSVNRVIYSRAIWTAALAPRSTGIEYQTHLKPKGSKYCWRCSMFLMGALTPRRGFLTMSATQLQSHSSSSGQPAISLQAFSWRFGAPHPVFTCITLPPWVRHQWPYRTKSAVVTCAISAMSFSIILPSQENHCNFWNYEQIRWLLHCDIKRVTKNQINLLFYFKVDNPAF